MKLRPWLLACASSTAMRHSVSVELTHQLAEATTVGRCNWSLLRLFGERRRAMLRGQFAGARA